MASIVGGLGLPHTPIFPMLVAREGEQSQTGRLFRTAAEHLRQMRPDLIIMFDTDHLNTFFFDNQPVFAIGLSDGFRGPCDEPPMVPVQTIPSHRKFAEHIHTHIVEQDFDVASIEEFQVDHSIVVPLHFVTPGMDVPVVPIFVKGHLPPMPTARRCHALGRAVRRAIKEWPEELRVVVVGSGSFSLEVSGPRMQPNSTFGVPDPEWAERVCQLLETNCIDDLLAEATSWQMLKAGNVGGELLNWIAMLGAIEDLRPTSLARQMENGHAYGIWR